MIRIGIIGLGKMGQNHLRNLSLLKQAQIAFVYDIDVKLTQELASQYQVPACTNLELVLQEVEGVIIATPTVTHHEYIVLASQYLKNIFVEKPLTNQLKTAEQIVALSQKKALNLQVGFIERYNTALIALKSLIQESDHIIAIDFMRTGKSSVRITDVDVVIDLMIHDIDLALDINGSAKKVEAYGCVNNGMIDYARATIYHNNGSFSNVLASRITEKKIRKIAVTCKDRYINCNLLSKELTLNQQLGSGSESHIEELIDIESQDALLLEINDFVKLCNNKQVKVSNEYDGLSAMQIATQIQNIIYENNG